MGLTRSEQETKIRWDEEAQVVHIWSASPVTWRKLERLGIRPLRETSVEGKPSGKSYALPLAQFRWRLKGKGKAQGNPDALRRAREARKQPPEGHQGTGGLG